ncbi:MAG: glycosyltransferase, partial [Planctomycetota bacterium]
PELIEDGASGLLVPPDDPAELAGAVLRVLRDRDLAKRLGEGARARVRERFTLGAMLAAYEAFYTTTLEAKGVRP